MNHISPVYLTSEMLIYDVRSISEFLQGHVENAINVPLTEIYELAREGLLSTKFPKDKTFYVHCKTGARSLMACSIFRKFGITT